MSSVWRRAFATTGSASALRPRIVVGKYFLNALFRADTHRDEATSPKSRPPMPSATIAKPSFSDQ